MNRSVILLEHKVGTIYPMNHWEDMVFDDLGISFPIEDSMDPRGEDKSIA